MLISLFYIAFLYATEPVNPTALLAKRDELRLQLAARQQELGQCMEHNNERLQQTNPVHEALAHFLLNNRVDVGAQPQVGPPLITAQLAEAIRQREALLKQIQMGSPLFN